MGYLVTSEIIINSFDAKVGDTFTNESGSSVSSVYKVNALESTANVLKIPTEAAIKVGMDMESIEPIVVTTIYQGEPLEVSLHSLAYEVSKGGVSVNAELASIGEIENYAAKDAGIVPEMEDVKTGKGKGSTAKEAQAKVESALEAALIDSAALSDDQVQAGIAMVVYSDTAKVGDDDGSDLTLNVVNIVKPPNTKPEIVDKTIYNFDFIVNTRTNIRFTNNRIQKKNTSNDGFSSLLNLFPDKFTPTANLNIEPGSNQNIGSFDVINPKFIVMLYHHENIFKDTYNMNIKRYGVGNSETNIEINKIDNFDVNQFSESVINQETLNINLYYGEATYFNFTNNDYGIYTFKINDDQGIQLLQYTYNTTSYNLIQIYS